MEKGAQEQQQKQEEEIKTREQIKRLARESFHTLVLHLRSRRFGRGSFRMQRIFPPSTTSDTQQKQATSNFARKVAASGDAMTTPTIVLQALMSAKETSSRETMQRKQGRCRKQDDDVAATLPSDATLAHALGVPLMKAAPASARFLAPSGLCCT